MREGWFCRKLGRDFFQVPDYPKDLTVKDSE
jgi:hypothetical protein